MNHLRRSLFYAVAALAFLPWVVFLGVGCIGVAIAAGLSKLHRWTHAELYEAGGFLDFGLDIPFGIHESGPHERGHECP